VNELGLNEYFTVHDEVKALRKENERLNHRLLSEIKSKSYWKCRFDKVRPKIKSIRTVKNQTAKTLIEARENGDKTHSLADIGRLLGIRYGTIKNMAFVYRQAML
tara:strand:+ start:196 stop:510 length:315 start_codon:yes stop_codon:yes gene_type:complete